MPEGFISHSFADSSTGFKIEKTEGDITTTILFDNDLNVVGEAIENTATGISFSETKTVSADGKTYTLAGDNDTGQTDKSFSFVYNVADDSLVSGTETIDGITYTYAADGTYVKTNTSVVSASINSILKQRNLYRKCF